MRLRVAAAIIRDGARDRVPSIEGELGDRCDEDSWDVAVADFDLAHEAEGVADVEHIGHCASVRAVAS